MEYKPVNLDVLPKALRERILKSRKWISRNSRCICGSRKRFKRCCAKGIRLR
jgi:uncharacterized protein YecA (UPF0149 family)